LTVTDSSIDHNEAFTGGGLLNFGTATLRRGGGTQNEAHPGGTGGGGTDPGALTPGNGTRRGHPGPAPGGPPRHAPNPTPASATLTSVTPSDPNGFAPFATSGNATLTDSIVDGGAFGSSCYQGTLFDNGSTAVAPLSGGHNIDSLTGCAFTGTGDQSHVNPG